MPRTASMNRKQVSFELRSHVSLEELTHGLVGGERCTQPPGLTHNFGVLPGARHCHAFPAGTPGTSWFAVFEALQNAGDVLSTCDTTQHGPAPIVTSAVASKSDRHQAAAHLLADAGSESMQAAIPQFFDGNIILEESAFRDLVSALCKLSLEMVCGQRAVCRCWCWRRGAVLEIEEDNIPSASTAVSGMVLQEEGW